MIVKADSNYVFAASWAHKSPPINMRCRNRQPRKAFSVLLWFNFQQKYSQKWHQIADSRLQICNHFLFFFLSSTTFALKMFWTRVRLDACVRFFQAGMSAILLPFTSRMWSAEPSAQLFIRANTCGSFPANGGQGSHHRPSSCNYYLVHKKKECTWSGFQDAVRRPTARQHLLIADAKLLQLWLSRQRLYAKGHHMQLPSKAE